MIFEMRTYRLQPGSVPEVEKRFGEALTERVKVSPLGAFFHTEVGPLNHIIHIWPYDDLQHRTRVRSQSIANCRPRPRNSSSRWKARSSMRRRSARLSRRGSTAIYTKSAPTRCSPRRRSAGRPALGRVRYGRRRLAACSSSRRTCSSSRRRSHRWGSGKTANGGRIGRRNYRTAHLRSRAASQQPPAPEAQAPPVTAAPALLALRRA